MARTPNAHAPHTRENSVNDDSDDLQVRIFRFLTILVTELPCQDQLFLLPNGEPASFLLHNFESVGLTKKIIVSYWLAFL
jgi:hypothetical protein